MPTVDMMHVAERGEGRPWRRRTVRRNAKCPGGCCGGDRSGRSYSRPDAPPAVGRKAAPLEPEASDPGDPGEVECALPAAFFPAAVEVTVAVRVSGGRAAEEEPRTGAGCYVRGHACGVFEPELYVSRMDCILYQGTHVSRSHFEKMGGSNMAKWYRSIRVLPNLEPLGEWLERHNLPVLKGAARRSRPRKPPMSSAAAAAAAAANLAADETGGEASGGGDCEAPAKRRAGSGEGCSSSCAEGDEPLPPQHHQHQQQHLPQPTLPVCPQLCPVGQAHQPPRPPVVSGVVPPRQETRRARRRATPEDHRPAVLHGCGPSEDEAEGTEALIYLSKPRMDGPCRPAQKARIEPSQPPQLPPQPQQPQHQQQRKVAPQAMAVYRRADGVEAGRFNYREGDSDGEAGDTEGSEDVFSTGGARGVFDVRFAQQRVPLVLNPAPVAAPPAALPPPIAGGCPPGHTGAPTTAQWALARQAEEEAMDAVVLQDVEARAMHGLKMEAAVATRPDHCELLLRVRKRHAHDYEGGLHDEGPRAAGCGGGSAAVSGNGNCRVNAGHAASLAGYAAAAAAAAATRGGYGMAPPPDSSAARALPYGCPAAPVGALCGKGGLGAGLGGGDVYAEDGADIDDLQLQAQLMCVGAPALLLSIQLEQMELLERLEALERLQQRLQTLHQRGALTSASAGLGPDGRGTVLGPLGAGDGRSRAGAAQSATDFRNNGRNHLYGTGDSRNSAYGCSRGSTSDVYGRSNGACGVYGAGGNAPGAVDACGEGLQLPARHAAVYGGRVGPPLEPSSYNVGTGMGRNAAGLVRFVRAGEHGCSAGPQEVELMQDDEEAQGFDEGVAVAEGAIGPLHHVVRQPWPRTRGQWPQQRWPAGPPGSAGGGGGGVGPVRGSARAPPAAHAHHNPYMRHHRGGAYGAERGEGEWE
uniref:RlsD n=1 Tax=Yamagishiella unicocca TaxID=51707 RepID=A0A1W6R6N2_9CHLO|nr:RlsD [Yamagishiella unicocca]